MPLLMASILAGLSMPVYEKLLRRTKKRSTVSAATTVVLLLLLIIVPSIILMGIVASQAVEVSESVGPWLQRQADRSDELDAFLAELPGAEKLAPYRGQITAKLAELTGTVGQYAVNALASATKGTASFFLGLFITLYGTFFFLKLGRGTLNRILYYVPLKSEHEDLLVGRFLSVARATLKGTLVIALVQGALGTIGLAIIGISGAVFWGAVIVVLSLIPAVGTSLIWVPVTIYLLAMGRVGAAVFIVLASHLGGQGHRDVRSHGVGEHTGWAGDLRDDRAARRSHPRRALRHGVGHLRRGVQERATASSGDRRGGLTSSQGDEGVESRTRLHKQCGRARGAVPFSASPRSSLAFSPCSCRWSRDSP
jgi:predicted PurR-regulated permease PerM